MLYGKPMEGKMTPAFFAKARLACAYFFAFPGLAYGIFTSRMPALKIQASLNDAQIGFLLLFFGMASFCGLLGSGWLIGKFTSKRLTLLTPFFFSVAFILLALCSSFEGMLIFAIFGGLGMSVCDVSMNAQGMELERQSHVLCISFLHASFSLGAVIGALCGSFFAWLALSPFLNMLIVLLIYILPIFPAYSMLLDASGVAAKKQINKKEKLPSIIFILGVISMLCYVSEGSVGEWGSLYLFTEKGAPQQIAALVFACFSTCMVICRFNADRLRKKFADSTLVLFGATLALGGMIGALVFPWPWLCLCCYGLMGIGFAPIVPILYSRAGSIPEISTARASWIVSLLSYTGLLFFPAFLGMLAQKYGLGNTLWIIAGTCACVAAGSLFLKSQTPGRN